MSSPAAWIMLGTLFTAIGLWLVLPRGNAPGKILGGVFTAIGFVILGNQVPSLAFWGSDAGWWDDVENVIFLSLVGLLFLSAVCSISLQKPVYCAIWFAVTLLSSAGLLLYLGAQFLGVATVVVYAGAILVTFLFVLMLAQPQGRAFYDRISWEGLLSATVGAVFMGIIITIISGFQLNPVPSQNAVVASSVARSLAAQADGVAAPASIASASSATTETGGVNEAVTHPRTLGPEHVARLGGELFSTHLITFYAAGVLLFVALAGAVAMAARDKLIGDNYRLTEDVAEVNRHG